MRKSKTKRGVWASLSEREILYAPVGDLVQGFFNVKLTDEEVLDFYKKQGKLPKWLVDDEGDLYLTLGALPGDRFGVIRIPSSSREPYGFFILVKTPSGEFILPGGNTYITRIPPKKLLGVAKKLKLVAENIRKREIISEALWYLPFRDLKLWRMHVRGMLTSLSQQKKDFLEALE